MTHTVTNFPYFAHNAKNFLPEEIMRKFKLNNTYLSGFRNRQVALANIFKPHPQRNRMLKMGQFKTAGLRNPECIVIQWKFLRLCSQTCLSSNSTFATE